MLKGKVGPSAHGYIIISSFCSQEIKLLFIYRQKAKSLEEFFLDQEGTHTYKPPAHWRPRQEILNFNINPDYLRRPCLKSAMGLSKEFMLRLGETGKTEKVFFSLKLTNQYCCHALLQ